MDMPISAGVNEVVCEGELLIAFKINEKILWRTKLWRSSSSRCCLSLSYNCKKKRYRLEARHPDQKQARMFFPLTRVKEYAFLHQNWHRVTLEDGRSFALRFFGCSEVFEREIKKALKLSGKKSNCILDESEAILVGPPVTEGELRREALRSEESFDECDGMDMSQRPLPPIPRIELSGDDDDFYEEISEVSFQEAQNLETLLQDAILFGREDEAAKYARELARAKKCIFISSGQIEFDSIQHYLSRPPLGNVQCLARYLTPSEIKDLTRNTLPPPVPPRIRGGSRSPSPAPRRKKPKTPDTDTYLSPISDMYLTVLEALPLERQSRRDTKKIEVWR